MQKQTQVTDINVVRTITLPSPTELRDQVLKSESQAQFVWNSRQEIHRIIFGNDNRLLVVVGPCSIHDVEGGFQYAEKLKDLSDKLSDRLYIVMRAYFEKPRTSLGWKGLIMDPYLDNSCDITHGLRLARTFLKDLIDLGLPTATEMLDPITPQYIADLVSWSAIGARTTESQTHRQMASGLSMPARVQEQHRGLRPGRYQRHQSRQPYPNFSGHKPDRQRLRRNYQGQSQLPPRNPWRLIRTQLPSQSNRPI